MTVLASFGPIEILKRPRIDVVIGKPFRLAPYQGGGKTAAAAEATEVIMRRIAELLPPELRGPYADSPAGPLALDFSCCGRRLRRSIRARRTTRFEVNC